MPNSVTVKKVIACSKTAVIQNTIAGGEIINALGGFTFPLSLPSMALEKFVRRLVEESLNSCKRD